MAKPLYCICCGVECLVCGANKTCYNCPKCYVYGDISSGRYVIYEEYLRHKEEQK